MKRYGLLVCLMCTTILMSFANDVTIKRTADKPGRQIIGFNDQWSFSKDEKDWSQVVLPHTWNAKDVMDDEPGYYRGTGWYKKTLNIQSSWKGKNLFLSFDGVNQETEVYINGKLAGQHLGGYTGFTIPITSFLKFDGNFKNEVLVKVTNRFNEDIAPLTADFTFFGGIYRKVSLVVTDAIHFAMNDYGSKGVYVQTPFVSAKTASVSVKSIVENSSSESRSIQINNVVYDKVGNVVAMHNRSLKLAAGERKAVLQDLPAIEKPDLWSPDMPTLYRVVTTILDTKSKSVIDLISNSLGFRWFKFDAEKGFFLNDKPLKLMGASRHQDYEGLGNAVPDALQIRDVVLLKEMGGNFLRVAHYPQDPVILDACDRLGILASVEIPVVNAITETVAFTDNCKNMLIEMIRQHYNHPSVVVWAYMNEVLLRPKFNNDKNRQQIYFEHVRELAQKLEDLTRKEDNSRYTMIACHGDFERYRDVGLTKIPMIVGWNLYQGWYGGELKGFGEFLDKHHEKLADKPVLVTEYGADADPRIRSFSPVRFDKSVEYAIGFNQVYLNDILKRPFVSGAMVWNLADFNSETREETMPHVNNKGLLTLGRKSKDTYYLYQAYLSDKPFIKIASKGWEYRTGISDPTTATCTQLIQIATNLNSAELFLNGKSLGLKTSKDHICEWQVPFVSGINQLRVVDAQNPANSDQTEIDFTLLPYRMSDALNFESAYILLGAERYFIDRSQQVTWIPDQPFRTGSWGHIGGQPFKGNNGRISYGSDKNILGTDDDPVYQTQQVDLKTYKLDVPNGEYELSLYFAELIGGAEKEPLVYNLQNKNVKEAAEQRVFNVNVNGNSFLENFNISAQYGYTTAVKKTTIIVVNNKQGISIDFIPITGKPVLNALSIRKIN